MKRLLIPILFLLSMNCTAQSWLIKVDSTAFNGITKICAVHGKTNDPKYSSPAFYITYSTKTKQYIAYLSDMPYGGCTSGFYPVKIRFDAEKTTYQVGVDYSASDAYDMLALVSEKAMKRRPNLHLLSYNKLIEKLQSCHIMHLRYMSSCASIEVEFTLEGAKDALAVLQ